MKHAWNFLGISPLCIIHIVHNKESATEGKSRAATFCDVQWENKLIMKRGHKDGRNGQKN